MGISHTTNPSEATQQPRVSNVPNGINSMLEDFDVLPSKANRYIFKYSWLYLLIFSCLYFGAGAFFLTRSCYAYQFKPHGCNAKMDFFSRFYHFFSALIIGHTKLIPGSIQVLCLIIGAILFLLFFNIWRIYVPKMLRDLIKNNRISARSRNTATLYQKFLDDYHRDLSNPISYLPCGILLAYALTYMVFLYSIIHQQQVDPAIPLNSIDARLLHISTLVFFAIIKIILLYSLGTMLSAIYISDRYVGKLLQDFQVKSNPAHLDHCGGLKILGNYCCWLTALLFSTILFLFPYDIVVIATIAPIGGGLQSLYWIDFVVIFLLGMAFALVFWVSVKPLWMIHTRMIDESEIFQQNQSTELAALQNQMQNLLDNNQLEQAKTVKEKKELLETLNTSYPRWPCIIFSAIPSLLSGSVSLLLPHILSVVLPELFHLHRH